MGYRDTLQLTPDRRLRHFLTIEGLPRATLVEILDTAESFFQVGAREVKKVPLLRGKTIVNLFFETSTRTRTTFELAAKRLSADVVNLNISVRHQRRRRQPRASHPGDAGHVHHPPSLR